MLRNAFVRTLARSCLVALFPFSAADKVFNWNEAIKQAKKGSLPAGAPMLMSAGIAVEALAPVAIVTSNTIARQQPCSRAFVSQRL